MSSISPKSVRSRLPRHRRHRPARRPGPPAARQRRHPRSGTLKTLKRFKDEVREVREGYECGMAFENYQDVQAGDVIENASRSKKWRARCSASIAIAAISSHRDEQLEMKVEDRNPGARLRGSAAGIAGPYSVSAGSARRCAIRCRRSCATGDAEIPEAARGQHHGERGGLSPDLRQAMVYVMPLAGAKAGEIMSAPERMRVSARPSRRRTFAAPCAGAGLCPRRRSTRPSGYRSLAGAAGGRARHIVRSRREGENDQHAG